jgi:hypothetical protein
LLKLGSSEEMDEVRIAVAAEKFFQVSIAYDARDDLVLNLGDSD